MNNDKNGFIDVDELFGRTRQFVREMTDGQQNPAQTGQSLNSPLTNIARAEKQR